MNNRSQTSHSVDYNLETAELLWNCSERVERMGRETMAKKMLITLGWLVPLLLGLLIFYHYTRMWPHANPQPEYFLDIEGHVEKGLQEKLSIVYWTNNPSCEKPVNFLEGVWGSREKDIDYSIQPDASGYYHFRAPLDILKPGYCRWQLAGISYCGASTVPKNPPMDCGNAASEDLPRDELINVMNS